MSANFRLGGLLLAAGALAIAFAAGGLWEWAIAFAAWGALAAAGTRWFGASLGTICLIIFVTAAATGMLLGLQPIALLVAVCAALAHWDLDAFGLRLSRADHTDLTRRLEKSHHLRLLVVLVLALAVSLLALSIRINLSLIGAMLLVLVIVISLRLGIAAIYKDGLSRPSQ